MLLLCVPVEVRGSLSAPQKQDRSVPATSVSIDKMKERALSLYKAGNYEQAISIFSTIAKALENRTRENDVSALGRAYTYIAQSYKRLKLRKETAAFY